MQRRLKLGDSLRTFFVFTVLFDVFSRGLDWVLMVTLLSLNYFVGHVEHTVLVDSAASHNIGKHQKIVEGFLERFFLFCEGEGLQEGA